MSDLLVAEQVDETQRQGAIRMNATRMTLVKVGIHRVILLVRIMLFLHRCSAPIPYDSEC
jgi:hypothetical protein